MTHPQFDCPSCRGQMRSIQHSGKDRIFYCPNRGCTDYCTVYTRSQVENREESEGLAAQAKGTNAPNDARLFS